ncbi:unnamed protein product [Closterium sp. NIES-53]
MLAAASARTRGGRAGGGGRGRSTREGGPENAFQMAARRALTELLKTNEAEALSGSIYEAEEEEEDSGSNASEDAQSQVPARQGGNSAHARSAATNFNRIPTQAQPSPQFRTATNNPDTTANQPAQRNPPPPPSIAPRTAAKGNHRQAQPPPQKSPEALAKDDTLFASVSNWNLDKLRDSRNSPLARRLPEKLRLLFAMVLLTPLLRLADDPDSTQAWTVLLFAARLTLHQQSPKHPDWKATRTTALKGSQLEPLLPLVHFSYGQPSALHLDAAFSHAPLLSETGVRQGDPLGPLLFAAAMQPALKAAAEANPDVICLAYADDVTFLGDPSSCAAAFEHFTSLLAEIGLKHNPAKCGAWSNRSPGDFPLPEGVPLSSDGLKVLGSYVGSPRATSAFVRSSLEAMGAPLGLIERMEPQLAGLLLSRCVSRRVSFLARTTPLPSLPKEEWSEWGRRLLETLLTACGINHPRGTEETARTWAQASLPVSLGGLGLTDPSVEGSYGFLASYTQAHLLLDSLEGDCTGPLEATREQMRGPYTQSSPLTEWLAECEGELPLPAQEALQAERAAPTAGKLQHGLASAIHAVQVEEVRGMSPNPNNGHTQRLLSLSGYGAGDWLNAVPLHRSLHLEAPHFANALQFRLGLPFAAPGVCNCTKKVVIPDKRLPNHLLRCGTGGGRTNTHNELRNECARMAREAGFMVHIETAAFSPVEEKKADLALRCRSTGAVYICDVTVTDPISTRDENATKGRGWAAREAADKKHGLYKDRPEWVKFFPFAVETYGCPCPETVDFLKLLAETVARRFFNAEPTSYQAAKLLHHFRQRWSVALQRGQSIGYLEKCSIAAAVENPLLEAVGEAPSRGDCLSVLDPALDQA